MVEVWISGPTSKAIEEEVSGACDWLGASGAVALVPLEACCLVEEASGFLVQRSRSQIRRTLSAPPVKTTGGAFWRGKETARTMWLCARV